MKSFISLHLEVALQVLDFLPLVDIFSLSLVSHASRKWCIYRLFRALALKGDMHVVLNGLLQERGGIKSCIRSAFPTPAP